jgi:hypothetical protein
MPASAAYAFAAMSFEGDSETRENEEVRMKAITGIFETRAQAERAVTKLEGAGVSSEKIVLLTPGTQSEAEVEKKENQTTAPTHERDMGKVAGALIGSAAAVGAVGGPLVAAIPGVGPVVVVGLMGAALLGAAGASVGAAVGGKVEKKLEKDEPESLVENELFVYEDSLRRGRSVVAVLAEEDQDPAAVYEMLKAEGGQTVDAAREQWWHDVRTQARTDYEKASAKFDEDEQFYRKGFEAALSAKVRRKPQGVALQEMKNTLQDLQSKNPGVEVAEPFSRGYSRGREYYDHVCNKTKAA